MSDKLKMHTPNKADENFKKLAALFPNAVTETIIGYDDNNKPIIERAIDKDILMQEISTTVVEGKDERYQFTWPDKKKSILLANAPINKTLRPCREESVNFDTTENLYIEGDNLEVLKLLQETYLGKIKMIYIDPPYNTGNDFIYEDDFAQSTEEYLSNSGQFDDQGNRLVHNTENSGRFHTDWLNFIYPRLKLAKDLLSNDGIIFISIDDNEVENLTTICNEIFGHSNAVTPFVWSLPRGINAGLIARAHEYVLVYCKDLKNRNNFNRLNNEIQYSIERCNKKIDSRHPESIIEFPAGVPYEGEDKILTGVIEGSEKITIIDELVFKDGKLDKPAKLSAGWTMKNMIQSWLQGKEVYDLKGQKIEGFFFKENGRLYSKKAMSTVSIKSVLKDIPDTQVARKEMEALFDSQDIFPYPKTLELPKLLSKLTLDKDDIILDFFSGSATTAHAVMQLNAEDNGNRKFIMVQLPEETDEKSEAYKADYKNICEIGKERIRRAAKKIAEENPDAKFDGGFRVLKCDSTNMKDVYYEPSQYTLNLFDDLVDNIKEDRTPEDLLFQIMLDLGVELSSPIEEVTIDDTQIYKVKDNYLVACFDKGLTKEIITVIAKMQPYYFVTRDNSMLNNDAATNFEQIFNRFSPGTDRRVL